MSSEKKKKTLLTQSHSISRQNGSEMTGTSVSALHSSERFCKSTLMVVMLHMQKQALGSTKCLLFAPSRQPYH